MVPVVETDLGLQRGLEGPWDDALDGKIRQQAACMPNISQRFGEGHEL